jgi:hypothetical protein
MNEDGGISMTIGSGAVGVLAGYVASVIRARIARSGTDGAEAHKGVDPIRCSELHGTNERDHRDLFSRVAILERDLAASRATQEAMRVTVERIDIKLDRLLERSGSRRPSPQED